MAKPRRAWVTITYDGKDITKQVSATLLTFEYADKAADEADEINITVHDHDGNWMSGWYPKVRVKGGDDDGYDTAEDYDYDSEYEDISL